MARLPAARTGKTVKNPPAGFPMHGERIPKRVITADVWGYLRQVVAERITKATIERRALAYVNQAEEFFDAARNPLMRSRPLLYYYSFLNLAKTFLLVRGVKIGPRPTHGLIDPKSNYGRDKLQLPGQEVILEHKGADVGVFQAMCTALRAPLRSQRRVKALDLLELIAGIHRTFTAATGRAVSFCPLRDVRLLSSNSEIFARATFDATHVDVRATLPVLQRRRTFAQLLRRVQPMEEGETWFETGGRRAVRSQANVAIRGLAQDFRRLGLYPVLTTHGFRYYVSSLPPARLMPQMLCIYAAMFLFGSMTRYRPEDLDRIERSSAWLVGDFLETQPVQFVYQLAGEFEDVEVVRPYALLE